MSAWTPRAGWCGSGCKSADLPHIEAYALSPLRGPSQKHGRQVKVTSGGEPYAARAAPAKGADALPNRTGTVLIITRRARLSVARVQQHQRSLTQRLRERGRASVSFVCASAALHAPESFLFRLVKIMGVWVRRKLEWAPRNP